MALLGKIDHEITCGWLSKHYGILPFCAKATKQRFGHDSRHGVWEIDYEQCV